MKKGLQHKLSARNHRSFDQGGDVNQLGQDPPPHLSNQITPDTVNQASVLKILSQQ